MPNGNGNGNNPNDPTPINSSGVMGYKITAGQLNAIQNQSFGDNQYFNPVQDVNGDWFIFEQEMEYCVKNKGWAKQPMEEYVAPAPDLGI